MGSGAGTTGTNGGTAGGGLNLGETSMQSSGRVETSIVVNVNTGKGDVDSQVQGGGQLGQQLEAAVNAVLVKNMRANGMLARA